MSCHFRLMYTGTSILALLFNAPHSVVVLATDGPSTDPSNLSSNLLQLDWAVVITAQKAFLASKMKSAASVVCKLAIHR